MVGHVSKGDDPRGRLRQTGARCLPRPPTKAASRHRFSSKNTASGDYACARRFDDIARLWDGRRPIRRPASASTPAMPTPVAKICWTSSTASRRSPAASTWCTPMTRKTPSTPARDRHDNFGQGQIDPKLIIAVGTRSRGRPPWWKRQAGSPNIAPTSPCSAKGVGRAR